MKPAETKPKVYDIDDMVNGYNDFNKLKEFHSNLISQILTTKPLTGSQVPLATLWDEGDRSGDYGWEMYHANGSVVILEYFGRWGYGHIQSPLPRNVQNSYRINRFRLTIFPSQPELEASIDKLLESYPRKEKTMAA